MDELSEVGCWAGLLPHDEDLEQVVAALSVLMNDVRAVEWVVMQPARRVASEETYRRALASGRLSSAEESAFSRAEEFMTTLGGVDPATKDVVLDALRELTKVSRGELAQLCSDLSVDELNVRPVGLALSVPFWARAALVNDEQAKDAGRDLEQWQVWPAKFSLARWSLVSVVLALVVSLLLIPTPFVLWSTAILTVLSVAFYSLNARPVVRARELLVEGEVPGIPVSDPYLMLMLHERRNLIARAQAAAEKLEAAGLLKAGDARREGVGEADAVAIRMCLELVPVWASLERIESQLKQLHTESEERAAAEAQLGQERDLFVSAARLIFDARRKAHELVEELEREAEDVSTQVQVAGERHLWRRFDKGRWEREARAVEELGKDETLKGLDPGEAPPKMSN